MSPWRDRQWKRVFCGANYGIAFSDFVVRIAIGASGRSSRYVALAITTAGCTLVSRAPTRMPTTTSPGFRPGPLIPPPQDGAARRLGIRSGRHRTTNQTSRSFGSARTRLAAPPGRIASSPHLEAGVGRRRLVRLLARLAAFPYPAFNIAAIGSLGRLGIGFYVSESCVRPKRRCGSRQRFLTTSRFPALALVLACGPVARLLGGGRSRLGRRRSFRALGVLLRFGW